MPVRYPAAKPGAGITPEQWQKILDATVIAPLAKMLGEFFHVDPADFDTIEEIEAKLQEFFGKIPILGDLIEIITGIEDGDTDDLGTWINGLKTILSGGTVTGLPTLGGALNLGGLQTMLQQIADILNGLVVTPINSAVQGVKDWFAGLVGWRSTTDTNVATATSNAASASSAASSAQTAVNQVATNITNAITGGVAAGTGAVAQAFDSIASIFGLASAANTAAISAQTQLAAQQNGSDSNTSGFSWSTQFSGSDGALSSSDWTTNGIQIVDGTGYAGIPSGSANGYYYALANYLLTTDTDSAVMTLGTLNGGNSSSFGGADYYTGLGIRCNADFTTGAFCRVNKSGIAIGKFTRSGTSMTFTVLTSASMTINAGDVIRFKASGSNYYALVNGSTKLSVTDSAGTISVGASYRSAGFFAQRAANLFFTDNSFRVASFGMSDWIDGSAAVTTPSWRLRRGSTTMASLAVTSGGSSAMPSGFFTVQDQLTDATVSSLGLGEVTIATAGWYEIGFTATALVTVTNGTPYVTCPWGAYVNSTLVQAPIAGGTRTVVYLAVGDVVSPYAVAATPAADAKATGASTNNSTKADVITGTQMTSGISSVGGPAATFTGRFLTAA